MNSTFGFVPMSAAGCAGIIVTIARTRQDVSLVFI
jgi:hypothetical protein